MLQDDSEEEADPTGSPTRRGVAPWLADAARAGGKRTETSASAPEEPSAVAAGAPPAEVTEEGSDSAAETAESPSVEEPAMVNLQTMHEPQRLSMADMAQSGSEPTAAEVPSPPVICSPEHG